MTTIKARDDFWDWINEIVRQKGPVGRFCEEYKGRGCWVPWSRWTRPPQPWHIDALTEALTEWTGEEFDADSIRNRLYPGWDNPKTFADWFRWTVEQRGPVSVFARESGINQTSACAWASGKAVPSEYNVRKLAEALTEWTGRTVTPEEIRKWANRPT